MANRKLTIETKTTGKRLQISWDLSWKDKDGEDSGMDGTNGFKNLDATQMANIKGMYENAYEQLGVPFKISQNDGDVKLTFNIPETQVLAVELVSLISLLTLNARQLAKLKSK